MKEFYFKNGNSYMIEGVEDLSEIVDEDLFRIIKEIIEEEIEEKGLDYKKLYEETLEDLEDAEQDLDRIRSIVS